MIYTLSSQSRRFVVLLLSVVLFSGVHAAGAQELRGFEINDQTVAGLDRLIEASDDGDQVGGLSTLYQRIASDAARFPREQTEREFLKVFGERIPTFGGRVDAEGNISVDSLGGQAVYKSIKDSTDRELFARNARFMDVYLMGKYLSTFMNGDVSDSGFDLFADLSEVEIALTGSDEEGSKFLPPRFGQGLTNTARFLKGTSAQAVTMDPNIRDQRIRELAESNTVTFKDGGIPVCTVPGVIQEKDAVLDEAAQTAVLGRLVDLNEAIATAEKTVSNKDLLNFKEEKPVWQKLLEGEEVPLPNWSDCLFDTFCARVDFIKSSPRLAPGRLERPYPIEISLKAIETITRMLSNTPLETKSVGRSPLSYTFFKLDFLSQTYTPTVSLDVRWVPIFQAYDPRKSFNADSFGQLLTNYRSLLEGGLERSVTTAVGVDRTAISQVLSDSEALAEIERNKEKHKSMILLRSQVYERQQYLKVVGDRLVQLSTQVGAMDTLFAKIQVEAERLSKAKPVYSK